MTQRTIDYFLAGSDGEAYYVGSYAAVLNGLDAIVFTAGVGENDPLVRTLVCQNMDYLGLALDEAQNQRRQPGLRELSAPGARARILVVPTNEELEIARQCAALPPAGQAL